MIRLQKFLSMNGVCSRRKGEEYIKSGIVAVNGNIVTKLGIKVDSINDSITVNGLPVKNSTKFLYIALNKPVGYITTCRRNQQSEKIVIDLIDCNQRIYPVGRLDKNSQGLLLLTNDGKIHHGLSHPSFDHEKEYKVTVEKNISDSSLSHMANGIIIDGAKTRKAIVQRLSSRIFIIILKEGRNRQIRKMIQKVNNRVILLERIRFSNILLGNLKEGDWRYLDVLEKKQLLKKIKCIM